MKTRRRNKTSRKNEFIRASADAAPIALHASAEFVAAQADGLPSAPKFSMLAYSGGAMNLKIDKHPTVLDLQGLDLGIKSRPILFNHDITKIVGHTESIAVKGSSLHVSGVISGTGISAQEVIATAKNGFPWQASIGAKVVEKKFVRDGERVTVNGRQFTGPLNLVTASRLGEVSFVALGADDNTSASVAAGATSNIDGSTNMEFDAWIKAYGFDISTMTETQVGKLRAAYEAEAKAGKDDDDGDGDIKATEKTDADAINSIRAARAAEVSRIAKISELCGGKHADIEAGAIRGGWSAERTELALLRASRPTPARRPESGAPDQGKVIEAAALISCGIMTADEASEEYGEKVVDAASDRSNRNVTIRGILRQAIAAAGGTIGFNASPLDLARTAYEADNAIKASDGYSTMSVVGLLGNTANKALLAGYQLIEQTAPMISREVDKPDFKNFTSYRLVSSGDFEEVGPTGELKSATLGEDGYSNRVKTRGMTLTLSREHIINDDLGAFLTLPRAMGRNAALARERAVYGALLSNPSNFFGTGNKNYQSGTGTVLSIDSFTAAEQLIRDQTDSKGVPIGLVPKILLVPTSLSTKAAQLMAQSALAITGTANRTEPTFNPHAGKCQVVTSTFLNAQGLSGSSATAWYLLADPNDTAVVEIAYLQATGRQPVIETGVADFGTLGVSFRCYSDFGVALQDPRAAVMSKGAA